MGWSPALQKSELGHLYDTRPPGLRLSTHPQGKSMEVFPPKTRFFPVKNGGRLNKNGCHAIATVIWPRIHRDFADGYGCG